ncbi:hypothetical protein L7F22_027761 [Adiantum nelumboides]|nr:hypothetical protein [Adiantum nelumboides]
MSSSAFGCSICLRDSPKEPVLTCCGHVFCWPCIFRWLTTKRACPLCNGCLSSPADFTPIYSSAKDQERDVDMKDVVDDAQLRPVDGDIPSRPPAHRRQTYSRTHLRPSQMGASSTPGIHHQQADDVQQQPEDVDLPAYFNYVTQPPSSTTHDERVEEPVQPFFLTRGAYLYVTLPVALSSGAYYRAPPPSPATSTEDDGNPSYS